MTEKPEKPLNRKAYGSIPHIPGSKKDRSDKTIPEGQVKILTEEPRDDKDKIIVTEKLDGSNVAVAKKEGEIIPLIRAGYRASGSNYKQHHLFDRWVKDRWNDFDKLLNEGERVIGEWLAQVHGTRYKWVNKDNVFQAFDIIDEDNNRILHDELIERCDEAKIETVTVLYERVGKPIQVSEATGKLDRFEEAARHDPPEGAVWRVERNNNVEFLAKWVRPEKEDGKYLPGLDHSVVDEKLWNWHPHKEHWYED